MQKPVRKHKKREIKIGNTQVDFMLVIITLLLLGLGIVMVLSASAPSALAESGNSYAYASKQLVFGLIGIFVMFFISRINYKVYKKYYWLIYAISVGVLLLVMVPGLGKTVNGATRWIKIAGQQIQPSEITKIGLIVFYAGYLADHKSELGSFGKGFIKPFIFLVPPVAILYFIQNHLSVSILLGIITATMMIVAGTKIMHFISTIALGGGVGVIALLSRTYEEWWWRWWRLSF